MRSFIASLIVTGALFLSSLAHAQGDAPATPPAEDAPLPDAQQARALEMVINVIQFAVLHEMGHMMVGELDLPVLGHSEDAADSFASVILLATSEDDANDTMRDTMHSWFLMEQSELDPANNDPDDISMFYDEHSLSISRGFSILCMLVGSSPERFAALATSMGMDDTRQQTCGFDVALAQESWQKLLAPSAVGAAASEPPATDVANTDTSDASADADDADASTLMTVFYEDEDDADLKSAMETLKTSGVLEGAADSVNKAYVMPRAIAINARSCDDGPNLDYNEDNAEIEVCYEFLDMMADLVAADIKANPDDYAGTVGPAPIPVDATFTDNVWIVEGVTPDPEMTVTAVAEDDPQYLGAWIAFSPDAIIWTKPGTGGAIDPSIDNCDAPGYAAAETAGFYDITCGTQSDVWGSVFAIDDTHLTLKWRDGAILSLVQTPGYSETETVMGYVEQNSIMTSLFAAINAAGMAETLDGAGPLTLVAPVDAAFRQLPTGMLAELLQPDNTDKLKQLLECHLIEGAFMSTDVPNGGADSDGDPVPVTTVGGCVLTFQVPKTGGITVTDENGVTGTLLYQDVGQANGALQVIDTVMTPKAP